MNGKDPHTKKPQQRDALDERYEDMLDDKMRAKMAQSERLYTGREDAVNRSKYSNVSAFESHGHRRIPPEVMRARARARMIRRAIPVAFAVIVCVIALSVYFAAIRPAGQYKKACTQFEVGNYNAARTVFDALGTYKDSEKYIAYIDAIFARDNGQWEQCAQGFDALGDFLDSAQRAQDARTQAGAPSSDEVAYQNACAAYDRGDYAAAQSAFAALGGYRDSAQRAQQAANEVTYAAADRAATEGNTGEAIRLFGQLGDYRDAPARKAALEHAQTTNDREQAYQNAKQAFENGNYTTANNAFVPLGDYRDSKQYADYSYAMLCRNKADYTTAEQCFRACGAFLDAADRATECKYERALLTYREGNLAEALTLFTELGDYADSPAQLASVKGEYQRDRYEQALFAYYGGDTATALEIFRELGDYSDSATWVKKITNPDPPAPTEQDTTTTQPTATEPQIPTT